MPRKLRGRPVSYGPAQLRALDTFLRGEYLMHLSGDRPHYWKANRFTKPGAPTSIQTTSILLFS